MSLFHRIAPSVLLLPLLAGLTARADERWAPHAVAGAVDQLEVAGNACGPAALLASFRCGSEKWRAASERIPGKSDRSKLLYIIRAHGLQPSSSLKNRKRWCRDGINVEDLTDIATEIARIGGTPALRGESLLRKGRESPERHLDRLHDRLRDSLKDGFPPILNLRRHVLRDGKWIALEGHFVSIVMVPEKLPRRARSFDFIYFDPWGARKCGGTFRAPSQPLMAPDGGEAVFLEADVPQARIGRAMVRAGESTVVVPTVMIGR